MTLKAPLCRRRETCRLCRGRALDPVLTLTPTPPANALVKAEALGEPQETFPLELFLCRSCGHLQMLDVVDASVLFEDYLYVSGTSPVFVRHFKEYAEDLLRRFKVPPGSLVIDVGSNDGTLLNFFKAAGHKVLGVDPAKEIAKRATSAGIETLAEFFTPELARRIKKDRGPAAVLTANNVFAHADDLRGFTEGALDVLSPDGIFAFEVSYLADVVGKTLFDTIYHEHLAYHSVKPLRRFLDAAGFKLIETFRVESHGGSLRAMAQPKEGRFPVGASVGEMIALEDKMGLDQPETFHAFAADIERSKNDLTRLLRALKAEGRKIAGYGAPAKATTLTHHFGLGADVIDFIVDDSPFKQGRFTPGHHIPILPSSAIYDKKPDYLLILAWNFARPIMAQHKAFSDQGGHFIVPLPRLEVI